MNLNAVKSQNYLTVPGLAKQPKNKSISKHEIKHSRLELQRSMCTCVAPKDI